MCVVAAGFSIIDLFYMQAFVSLEKG